MRKAGLAQSSPAISLSLTLTKPLLYRPGIWVLCEKCLGSHLSGFQVSRIGVWGVMVDLRCEKGSGMHGIVQAHQCRIKNPLALKHSRWSRQSCSTQSCLVCLIMQSQYYRSRRLFCPGDLFCLAYGKKKMSLNQVIWFKLRWQSTYTRNNTT